MTPLIPYVVVPGTWAWDSSWYKDGPWSQMMITKGFHHFKVNGRCFVWTTDVNGHRFWRRWFGQPDWRDWEATGYNLGDHLYSRLAPEHTNIFAHSHGLQPVLIAAALGLKIRALVSIMSPPREDMWIMVNGARVDVLPAARKNIDYWHHMHSDHTDRWAMRGLVGNGQFDRFSGNQRAHPWATVDGGGVNHYIPGVGHSRILNEPELFHHWESPLGAVRFLAPSPFSSPVSKGY